MTFNFHVHHVQIILQVAENVAQNESFVLSKVTPASKVPPFDGTCNSWHILHYRVSVILLLRWRPQLLIKYHARYPMATGKTPAKVIIYPMVDPLPTLVNDMYPFMAPGE